MNEAFEEWLKTYQGRTHTGYINRREAIEIFNAGYYAARYDDALKTQDVGEGCSCGYLDGVYDA